MPRKLSRRQLLADAGLLATGLVLTACGGDAATSTSTSAGQAKTVPSATTAAAVKEEKVHWAYEGKEGPEEWGKLDPAWAICKTGQAQTPIDITGTFQPSQLKNIKLEYGDSPINLENNGHTIQFNYQAGSAMTVDGKKYDLAQFHFHSPSEHKINGKAASMEVHLVHKAADNSLAVVGIMLEEGAENEFLAKFWSKIPAKKETKASDAAMVNAKGLLPSAKAYYTYDGSLTTPGCSEGVRWIVMKNPITVSKAQLEEFRKDVGATTNRPIQPLNGRVIGEGTF